jgi:hypothetical protein
MAYEEDVRVQVRADVNFALATRRLERGNRNVNRCWHCRASPVAQPHNRSYCGTGTSCILGLRSSAK